MAFGQKKTATRVEPRRSERFPARATVTVRLAVGDPIEVPVENASAGGLSAQIPLDLAEGTLLRIGLPSGRAPHARVVWHRDGLTGCEFMGPLGEDDLFALLPSPAPESPNEA